MTKLEANVDDMTGEHLAHCVQLLLDSGAADAWVTPIIMKKGRPAHTLHCLCHEKDRDLLLETLFRHSSSLGVRIQNIQRAALERTMTKVQVYDRDVDVKIGYLGDREVVSIKAEFDHCKSVSIETGIPIKTIADRAEALARREFEQER